MSTAQRKTPIGLYRSGVAALDQALGSVESLRFLRLVDPGSGDYTAECQTRMDQDLNSVDVLSAPPSMPPEPYLLHQLITHPLESLGEEP